MSGPRCNLPPERHEEILAMFSGELSADEESEIRDMFPQYLFFRNEYTDDGWEVSQKPVRLCTCTACGETFEAVRGNYPRGKLHGEPCNCPQCGRPVEGRAVHKYKYEMRSLESWVKTAVLRVTDDGALLIEAGDERRRFNWDNLTGEISWYPARRYYIAPGVVQSWYYKFTEWSCEAGRWLREWTAQKTVQDAHAPQRDVETLKKQLTLADPAVKDFSAAFDRAQDELRHMNTALHEIGDEEIKGKLLKASVAMLEGFLERVKE